MMAVQSPTTTKNLNWALPRENNLVHLPQEQVWTKWNMLTGKQLKVLVH